MAIQIPTLRQLILPCKKAHLGAEEKWIAVKIELPL